MDPQVEYPRRQRLFRRALYVLFAMQVACIAAYFVGWFSVGWAGLALFVLIVGGSALLTRGVRWVQAAQPRVEITPAQATVVAQARTTFIRRYGVLGFGLAWGVWMAAKGTWDAMPDHSLVGLTSPAALRRFGFALLVWIPGGLLAGYLWGRIMWRMFTPKTDVSTG